MTKKQKKVATNKSPKSNALGSSNEVGNDTRRLRLPSLAIARFRGFKELVLPKLGQVTLIVGRNGVGKSTILEAVQLYASAGDHHAITKLLHKRENLLERSSFEKEVPYFERERLMPDHRSLFFGYDALKLGDSIEIGKEGDGKALEVKLANFKLRELKRANTLLLGEDARCLQISFDRKLVGKIPFIRAGKGTATEHKAVGRAETIGVWNADHANSVSVDFQLVGPGLPSNDQIVHLFEDLLWSTDEKVLLDILRFVDEDIEGLASKGGAGGFVSNRRMIVKRRNQRAQVPLRSLGDGIVRLLALAVTIYRTVGGFLLVDEIENGIYHELFPDMWNFIMKTAQRNGVQVLATTHSWDCVVGFAKAALDNEGIEGRVFRIERDGEKTPAILFTEEELAIAARRHIEIR